MSCSDTFYPGNSEKKNLLAECYQFKTLLQDCFTAINDLTDCIEENYPGQQFEKIYVQKFASLGDNCGIILQRANQVETFLEWKGFDVEELMDTVMYINLWDLNKKFEEQIEISKNTQYSLVGIAITLSCFLSVTLIKKGYVSENDILKFGIVKMCFFVSAILAVICVGIDMIFSVIYGAFERKELEQFHEEYRTALEDFKTAARKWYSNMHTISDKIKVQMKKTNSTLCAPTE